MANVYYQVFTAGECEASKPCKTLREARIERREIIQEDRALGLEPGDIEYEIWKITEGDGVRQDELIE